MTLEEALNDCTNYNFLVGTNYSEGKTSITVRSITVWKYGGDNDWHAVAVYEIDGTGKTGQTRASVLSQKKQM